MYLPKLYSAKKGVSRPLINSRTPLFVSIVFIHGLRFSSACKVDDRFLGLFGRSNF